MNELILQQRSILVLLASLSLLLGIGVNILIYQFGFGPLIAGFLIILTSITIIASIPIAWLKITRLINKLQKWHLLWGLLFLSGLTFRIREAESITENPLDFAAVFRIGLVGIVGLVLLVFFVFHRRFKYTQAFGGLVGLLTIYSLICIFSTLWSVYPAFTLYKSTEYLIGVMLIGAILYSFKSDTDFKNLFDWMWLLIGLVALSVWMSVLLWPDEAIIRGVGLLGVQIKGLFPKVSANGVGDIGAILSIISFVRIYFTKGLSRQFYFALFIVGLTMLIISQSRSPLAGFILAVFVTLFLSGKAKWLTTLGISVILLLSFTTLGDYLLQFFLRGQSQELFLSLSGRVYYWTEALTFVKENPFTGYGAYAAGRFLVAKEFSSTLSSLHGTWPEVLIGVGFLGLLPLIGAVVGTWFFLFKKPLGNYSILSEQLRLEAIGIMTLLSVRSIFSVSFIWHPALVWLLVLGYAEFLRRKYKTIT